MNEEVIKKFYSAFSELDSQAMIECYHKDIVFADPAFGTLKGERAKTMWTMLCKTAKDLKIEFSRLEANAEAGKVHWDVAYTLATSGRKVKNSIDAEFIFKDGKIISHIDTFNLHTWAKQAMGFQGLVLGGTSLFKKRLLQQTNRLLDNFIASS